MMRKGFSALSDFHLVNREMRQGRKTVHGGDAETQRRIREKRV
jgi:hypothetical protein